MRAVVATLVVLAGAAPAAAADGQIRAYFGGTFGGSTTFVDLEHASGKLNPTIGGSFVLLGNIFGMDVDVADAPGFFQTGDSGLVLSSRVTMLSGNLVVAAPRSKTEYGIRPYLVAGGGVLRVRSHDYFGAFDFSSVLPALDFGAGAVGFFTNRTGIAWEFRRFQSFGGQEQGFSIGKEQLSFWRATMAFVYRY